MQDIGTQEIAALSQAEIMMIETAAKGIAGLAKGSIKAIAFLKAAFQKEKLMGKTDLENILKKVVNEGGEIMFFQFDETKLEKFEKSAERYGLLYSIAKDLNKRDGLTEIIFHSSQAKQLEHIMEDIGVGRVITPDEYAKGAEDKKKESASEDNSKNTDKTKGAEDNKKNKLKSKDGNAQKNNKRHKGKETATPNENGKSKGAETNQEMPIKDKLKELDNAEPVLFNSQSQKLTVDKSVKSKVK